MDRPVYRNNEGGRYASLIVQTLQDPETGTPEFRAMYKKFASRILWMDGDVVPGAFQMNVAWYKDVPERDPVFPEHRHDSDELIGFFSSDPEAPYDLGAEISVCIDGEEHILTKSTLLFIPAGLPHMPMSIRRVDRPVFHFSVVQESHYGEGAYK